MEAVYLYGLVAPNGGYDNMPDVPDFDDINKRCQGIINDISGEDYDSASKAAADLASDYSMGTELKEYVESSRVEIQGFHDSLVEAHNILDRGIDNLSEAYLRDLIEDALCVIGRALPSSKFGDDMIYPAFHCWYATQMISNFICVRRGLFNYEKDGSYKLVLNNRGLSCVITTNGTTLSFALSNGKSLKISREGDLVFHNTMIRAYDFSRHFDVWYKPTQEERGLYDILYPGVDWDVFDFLIQYDNDRPEGR